MNIITRFAPSPTGHLHLGHAYSLLFSYQKAKELGGKFLVRIEDIDVTRCKKQYKSSIFQDIEFFGIESDFPIRQQSLHFDDYEYFIKKLDKMGLLYPCFCTRKQIKEKATKQTPEGLFYPNICKNLTQKEIKQKIKQKIPYVLRLDVPKAFDFVISKYGGLMWEDINFGKTIASPAIFGDVVIKRKETPTSYHLSVVADDAIQNVSLVTRGKDLIFSTHIHRLLQALLKLDFPKYCHHELLKEKNGNKLSKTHYSKPIKEFIKEGFCRQDLIKLINKELEENDEKYTIL